MHKKDFYKHIIKSVIILAIIYIIIVGLTTRQYIENPELLHLEKRYF